MTSYYYNVLAVSFMSSHVEIPCKIMKNNEV